MKKERYTMEEWMLLDPEGERAAFKANRQPEGVQNPYEDETTEISDVLGVISDFVLDSLPEAGRLATEASEALDAAVEAMEDRQEGDFHVMLMQDDAAVEVAYVVKANVAKMVVAFKIGDELIKVSIDHMTPSPFGGNDQVPDYVRDIIKKMGQRQGASVALAFG